MLVESTSNQSINEELDPKVKWRDWNQILWGRLVLSATKVLKPPSPPSLLSSSNNNTFWWIFRRCLHRLMVWFALHDPRVITRQRSRSEKRRALPQK
jgi:hypothetical protein